MKNIYLIATTITIALFFGACGDSDESPVTNITISDCNTSNYTDILAGDTIVQDEDNTSIQTLFNTDSSQKVCVLTGSAHIVR